MLGIDLDRQGLLRCKSALLDELAGGLKESGGSSEELWRCRRRWCQRRGAK
jgi:hypothetical protein